VRISYERGLSPKELTPELLDEASIAYMGQPLGVSEKVLQEALDPAASVSRRTLYGGPAPSEVKERIPEYVAELDDDVSKVAQARLHVDSGLVELEKAIDDLVAKES
jgi:argininosuccinate lyase